MLYRITEMHLLLQIPYYSGNSWLWRKCFCSFLIILVVCSCSSDKRHGQDESTQSKQFDLISDLPAKSAIVIKNNGDSTARFSMSINDNLFTNVPDLLDKIKNPSSEFNEEPLHRKAWRFVKNHSRYSSSLSAARWQHAPLLFFNSIGFGRCDDRASVLHFIWKELGFETRIWALSGHVVSEVRINNHWEMYDPHLEVYYLNDDGAVAGVEELALNPTLITSPNLVLEEGKSLMSLVLRYSKNLAAKYSSINDNQISGFFSASVSHDQLAFEIPRGSMFTFPMIGEPSLLTTDDNLSHGFANAELSLPQLWKGKISIALVIHSIQGYGKVIIDARELKIGSSELNERISDRSSFFHELELEIAEGGARIVYLINPVLTHLSENNQLRLEGTHLQHITAEIIELTYAQRVPTDGVEKMSQMIKDYSANLQRLRAHPEIRALNVENKAGLFKKIKLFIECDTRISELDKSRQVDETESQLEIFFKNNSTGDAVDQAIKRMDENSIFVLIFTLMKFETSEKFARISRQYLQRNNN